MDEQECRWLSEAFGALANPNRLRMFQQIRMKELECSGDGGECTFTDHCCNVGELAAELDITSATVSHHLKELSHAGLVVPTRQGRFIYCTVDHSAVVRLRTFLEAGAAPLPQTAGAGRQW